MVNPPLEASKGTTSTESCLTVSIEKEFLKVGCPLSLRPNASLTDTPSTVISLVLGLLPITESEKKSSDEPTATLGSRDAIS